MNERESEETRLVLVWHKHYKNLLDKAENYRLTTNTDTNLIVTNNWKQLDRIRGLEIITVHPNSQPTRTWQYTYHPLAQHDYDEESS